MYIEGEEIGEKERMTREEGVYCGERGREKERMGKGYDELGRTDDRRMSRE